MRAIRHRILGGFITVLICLTMSCDNNAAKSHQFATPVEPPFTKEGELVFLDQISRDTLKQIDIEISDTESTIQRGMMFRRKMASDAGMLFIFPQAKPQGFWMKNTYISLDMIFVDEQQRIVTIQPHTTPLSEQSVPSSKPAQYVIEVVAGFCEKNGIKEGDFVTFRRINA